MNILQTPVRATEILFCLKVRTLYFVAEIIFFVHQFFEFDLIAQLLIHIRIGGIFPNFPPFRLPSITFPFLPFRVPHELNRKEHQPNG